MSCRRAPARFPTSLEAMIVGPATPLDERGNDYVAAILPDFEVTLYCGTRIVDHGRGRDALDSPALALQHLARVIAGQPEAEPLCAGEIVTTGTLTDAWPIVAGQRWRSDYGSLRVPGIDLMIE